jgi:glycosyltransferase involved in cell wall biosynthesis
METRNFDENPAITIFRQNRQYRICKIQFQVNSLLMVLSQTEIFEDLRRLADWIKHRGIFEPESMRILIALTYYHPHISGLTIYAQRLAHAFQSRGHSVTVLTSQFHPDLPREEFQKGIRIVRSPVALRISKGVIMPAFGRIAHRLVKEHDVVNLHLPQFDAARVAWHGRRLHKPTIITYQCDLRLPPGVVNRLADRVIGAMNRLAAIWSDRIVTCTEDYAEHSVFTRRYLHKVRVVDPPVELPEVTDEEVAQFKIGHCPADATPVIGMAARFATEKGVEVLLAALPKILETFPRAIVQFVGPYQNIIGEESYFKQLWPAIEPYQKSGRWQFLGILDPRKMALFFRSISLLVLPSLNSTEAFGMVQIEAMLSSVPCICSDLAGVRQPIIRHGMGKIIPVGDAIALAEAVVEILSRRETYTVNTRALRVQYAADTIARQYEILFDEIAKETKLA